MEQIIATHNKRILNSPTNNENSCNCRQKASCPVNNKCQENSIVYRALIKPNVEDNQQTTQTIPDEAEYIGLSSSSFKTRFNNHKLTFNQERYKQSTSLSSYVWELKQKNINHKIDWSIIKKAPTYHPSRKKCSLCTLEKTMILMSDHKFPLNKRSEILSKCRHREKFLLNKYV